jgi:hypothetical protein
MELVLTFGMGLVTLLSMIGYSIMWGAGLAIGLAIGNIIFKKIVSSTNRGGNIDNTCNILDRVDRIFVGARKNQNPVRD